MWITINAFRFSSFTPQSFTSCSLNSKLPDIFTHTIKFDYLNNFGKIKCAINQDIRSTGICLSHFLTIIKSMKMKIFLSSPTKRLLDNPQMYPVLLSIMLSSNLILEIATCTVALIIHISPSKYRIISLFVLSDGKSRYSIKVCLKTVT